jgi:hypothetical protein
MPTTPKLVFFFFFFLEFNHLLVSVGYCQTLLVRFLHGVLIKEYSKLFDAWCDIISAKKIDSNKGYDIYIYIWQTKNLVLSNQCLITHIGCWYVLLQILLFQIHRFYRLIIEPRL